jgi:hypothetical protein
VAFIGDENVDGKQNCYQWSVRDATLKKARQAEAAAHMDEWLNSPGLQPPKKDDTPDPN